MLPTMLHLKYLTQLELWYLFGQLSPKFHTLYKGQIESSIQRQELPGTGDLPEINSQ